MYSSVVLVFFFYLAVLNGLDVALDSSVGKTNHTDDLALKDSNATIANSSTNAISNAASLGNSEVNTQQPNSSEISNQTSNQQNVTDSSEIQSRIGLSLEQPQLDTFNSPNGFVPSFLKTFRRKRNLAVTED